MESRISSSGHFIINITETVLNWIHNRSILSVVTLYAISSNGLSVQFDSLCLIFSTPLLNLKRTQFDFIAEGAVLLTRSESKLNLKKTILMSFSLFSLLPTSLKIFYTIYFQEKESFWKILVNGVPLG